VRRAAGLLVLALAAGCGGGGGGEVSSEESAARLEQQRTQVRALTRDLTAAATSAVGGSVRTASARWEGCRSAFNETYASYRYAAQVRLDASGGDLLGPLQQVVSAAGLSPTEDAEPDKLRAARDDLSVSFWQLPAGSEGALLLTVQGDCVDVPEDQRDAWRDRQEDQPDPLA
jgi:hypothetical protein